MIKRQLIVLVALFAMWPARVYAQSDILDWLAELSGPGPFHAKNLITLRAAELRVWCFHKSGVQAMALGKHVASCLLDDEDEKNTRALVTFGYSLAESGSQPLFRDDPNDVRNVHQSTFSVMLMYRADRIVDVGGGVQWKRFSTDEGNSFSFWRVGLTPARVTLTPFRAIPTTSSSWQSVERLVHFQFEEDWLPQGFTGADFNNRTTRFNVGAEFQSRVSVLFDIGSFINVVRRR